MAWRAGGGGGWRAWAYPAVGFGAALALTSMPGLPFAAVHWPARGPFGAFTWAAWFVSTGLAVTLGLLGAELHGPSAAGRARVRVRRGGPARAGRVLAAAAGFALLAGLAYAAASRVELIQRHPLGALALAVLALAAMRGLAFFATRPGPAAPGPPAAGPEPSRPRAASAPAADDDGPDAMPRWASLLATAMAGLLVLVVAAGAAMRWLGPGLGLTLTITHPTPIFWADTSYFEYDAARRAGADPAPYLRPPEPGGVEAARRGVLPPGVRLAIKGWVDDGVQVRVEHDPGSPGKLVGEWGYVRLRDVSE